MSIAQESFVLIVLGISLPLVGRLRFQYPAGISYGDRIVRNTLCHHAASANDDVAPNLDAGKYHCIGANPHIVTYSDGVSLIMTIVVVLAVIGTYYAYVDPDPCIRAKDDAIGTLDVTAGIVARMRPTSNLNSVVADHF